MARFGLTAARVFDGHRLVDRPALLVEDDRVVSVGESLPESVDVIDLGEATILPGLVDCHQHLVFDGQGTLEEQVIGLSDQELRERARVAARRALEGGVTALRDLGDRNFVTLGLRDDPSLAKVVAAGPPITPPGGHCWYLGGECVGGDDLRAAVAERDERGSDLIKMMVTGGAMTPTFPLWELQYTSDEVRTVVDEAHARGLPVAAHCHGVTGIEVAAEAGVDSIEHCTFMNESLTSTPRPALLEKLAESGIAISATIGHTGPPPYPPHWAAAVPVVRDAFARVHSEGGVVVVGTDAGINPLKPHDVLPHAYPELVETLGMSPVEAMCAITSAAADVCGLPGHGRLCPGGPADIVAIAGDPFSDPVVMTKIESVWKAGRAVVTPA